MITIDDVIAVITVGTPARHRGLAVYPLGSERKGGSAAYLLLDEALATGRFRITEVSDGGHVPRLLAVNETGSPVFLLDGEELVGAKQNRVLNLSIMLAPNSKTEIPVSCVEAGRWRTETPAFLSEGRVQFARGRAQKLEQVSQSLRVSGEPRSDQHAVWDAISAKSARMRVASPTAAMAALFDTCRSDLRDYADAIPPSEGQIGAAYAIGDSLAGIELFDSDATFGKLAAKLLESYALDAMELEKEAEPPAASIVHSFLQSVGAARRERVPGIGIGETVRLSAEGLVGAALEVSGGCVHLSAFRRDASEDRHPGRETRISRPSARAGRW